MDHGPPGSSVHRILQARIQEWVAMSYKLIILPNTTSKKNGERMANMKETSVFLEKKMQKKKKKVPHNNKKGPYQEHITWMSAFAATLES